ncbi:MAG TPA: efflux RND transporter periplasmic adaptor subunit [Polyangiaceae bacterium]
MNELVGSQCMCRFGPGSSQLSMTQKYLKSLLLSAVVLIGCGASELPRADPQPTPIATKLALAHHENLYVLYRASGTVRGRTTAVLTSKTTGYVRSVDVHPGDFVRAGQVLAVLEANDSTASVRRAQAGFDQALEARAEAENALQAADAALRIAQSTHDRIAALFASHAIPQQEYDEVEARLQGAIAEQQMAKARLRSASSRIDQSKAEVGEAQATLDYARITAPFAGQVVERRIDPGNLAAPGTPLLVVEQDGRPRVEAAVEESRAASVTLGDTATVDIEAAPEPVIATISEIVPIVDVASRAFLVKLDLPEALKGLRSGMFARVSFRVGMTARLVVPSTAITVNGALDRVFAVDGDHLRLRMVTLGEKQGPWTEVLSGLADGERVAAAPTALLSDGARFVEQQ